jgi:L-asparagine permease
MDNPPPTQAAPPAVHTADDGYRKALSNRQIQMIAMGGAIGVGLFLGAGSRLQAMGPSLILAYLVCGTVAFFVMRALGELVMYRPSSGSFASYAREFIGPGAGFVSGWMFWFNWGVGGVAELTAIGIYVHKWLPDLAQWVTALIALAILLAVNLLSVKAFGEFEFWFAIVKVAAIVCFLGVGIWLVATGAQIGGGTAGLGNLFRGDSVWTSFFPAGFAIALLSLQSVIMAYNGIEMVGIAAGETAQPRKVIPRAVNSVALRIILFYCGSVLLLVMIMPWTAYGATESPFVLVFSELGVPAAGHIMNIVVITAALSSTNSGLYSTGRILRSMAERQQAPRILSHMSRRGIPAGGIIFTAVAALPGVALSYVVPHEAFDIILALAGLGALCTWTTILASHLGMLRQRRRNGEQREAFRMPFAPYSNYIAIAFLLMVVVSLGLAPDLAARVALCAIPPIALVLFLGWRSVRGRVTTQEVFIATEDRTPGL